ncbi:hypothetical protein RND81_14G007700 [Saponaria officinalis]|uniref:F-box domain-containing protein n=1 Tax=Saponaria officinalis TaxID=3572 RepID=A0AAW1GQY1_SAPOF
MERKHVGNKKRPRNSSPTLDCNTSIILHSNKNGDDDMSFGQSSPSFSSSTPTPTPATSMVEKSKDVPSSIWMQIIGRLPIKTLNDCRYVCRSWRFLVTESYFYRLYSQHMPTSLILQIKGSSLDVLKQIFFIEFCICKNNDNSSSLMRKLRFSRRRIYRKKNQESGLMIGPNFQFQLGNSCNGLVCVREISSREPSLVWNPMTRQYVVLPKPANTSDDKVVSGFGFCGRTSRYKVVRIYHRNLDPQLKLRVEIYELGVGDNWRVIGDAPFPIPSRIPGFYTHNSIHWILGDEDGNNNNTSISDLICGFDFIDEKFKTITPPPIYSADEKNKYHWSNLGIIGGCLSICSIDAKIFRADVQVWVMEEYGVPESWTMRLSIRDPTVNWWDPHRWMQVTNIGIDGEIVMLCAHSYLLSYSVRERRFRSVEELKFPAIAVAPSFISLEKVLCEKLGTGSLNVRYL